MWTDAPRAVRQRADHVTVDDDARREAEERDVTLISCPCDSTSGRASRACGATNVSTIASTPQFMITGPPAERL